MITQPIPYFFAAITLEIFALLVTVLLFMSDLLTQEQRDRKERLFVAMLLVNAAALVCDMITWIFEGPQYTVLIYTANFFVFALGYVMTVLFTAYLGNFVAEKRATDLWIMRFVYVLSVVSVALVVVSLFNGMYFYVTDGIIHAGNAGWLSIVLSLVAMVADMMLILRNKKEFGAQNTLGFLSYCIFPIIAFIIQMSGTELTVTWLASTLTMLLIYLMVHVGYVRELDRKKVELSESRMRLAENQKKLEESQTALMISQIQPHFLYNSLTVVDQLIRTDPDMARKALSSFSTYLRGNLGSLKHNGMIPFSDEMRHIRAYLELEQMRYGEYLHVVYEIETENFDVPSLSVQPLVENAVQHGLADQSEGGTVTISVKELPGRYVISVADDGAGFAPGETKGTGAHIGIENIRSRLTLMCGGSLDVLSEKGNGTQAIVTIFKLPEDAEIIDAENPKSFRSGHTKRRMSRNENFSSR